MLLSEKETIQTLGSESWFAEIVARALGSLASGSCTAREFPELISLELVHLSIPPSRDITEDLAEEMLSEFDVLLEQYGGMEEGESLALEFQ